MKKDVLKDIITCLITKSISENRITRQSAEDLVQEAYYIAKSKLSDEDLNDSKRLYCYMNACISKTLRCNKRNYAREALEFFEKIESSRYDNHVQDLRDTLTGYNIYDIEQIEIIILKVNGYNLKEIGKLMEVNYENLKKKWAKIKKSFSHFPFSKD